MILKYFAGWFCFRRKCWLLILKRNTLIQKFLILFPSFKQVVWSVCLSKHKHWGKANKHSYGKTKLLYIGIEAEKWGKALFLINFLLTRVSYLLKSRKCHIFLGEKNCQWHELVFVFTEKLVLTDLRNWNLKHMKARIWPFTR